MGHGHHHHDKRAQSSRRLSLTLALTTSYMIAEIVGGIASGSLALLADAGHMASDAGALALALFAMWIAQRPAGAQRTFGYRRTEILAALANGTALMVVAIGILLEAYERFDNPPEVRGGLMLAVASGGLAINVVALLILHGSRSDNLNVRAAFLHVASDALGSVGAMTSGTLIMLYGWRWADPAASAIIALLVIHSAWTLVKETVAVLMEAAPDDIDVQAMRDAMRDTASVLEVHDLHVWTITSDQVCMSAHVVTKSGAEQQETLHALTELVRERFGIHHVTIQLEDERQSSLDCHDCQATDHPDAA
jgi:cobalt-zinc-cadmium efflux system protein